MATQHYYNWTNYGTVSNNVSITFPQNFFTNAERKHFLFEGGTVGKGELVLSVLKDQTNLIAETSTWIELHDIKDFYERLIITNRIAGSATNWVVGAHLLETERSSALGNDTNIIIYAHGADNDIPSWHIRSDTIFKRLYWTGYHGRLATIRWPSPVITLDYGGDWFNITELMALKSASVVTNYVAQLQTRFPNHRLNMWAHSAGGPLASEAASLGAPFSTVILSAATVSASCFDPNAPTNSILLGRESTEATPLSQPMGYKGAHTNIANTTRIVNYFNVSDEDLISLWALWNQRWLKPSASYVYNGTNSVYSLSTSDGVNSFTITYNVTDPQESRAMISRSRTEAIGAQGPATGQTTQGVIDDAVDAHAEFGLGPEDEEHGGFFMRPFQTIAPYYSHVLDDCGILP